MMIGYVGPCKENLQVANNGLQLPQATNDAGSSSFRLAEAWLRAFFLVSLPKGSRVVVWYILSGARTSTISRDIILELGPLGLP